MDFVIVSWGIILFNGWSSLLLYTYVYELLTSKKGETHKKIITLLITRGLESLYVDWRVYVFNLEGLTSTYYKDIEAIYYLYPPHFSISGIEPIYCN